MGQCGDLWDLYTLKDEYQRSETDNFRSFYTSDSDVFVLEPLVSKFLMENGMKAEYPENKKFAVCLTHDIDDIYPPLSHTLLSSISYMKGLNFNGLKSQIFWKLKGKEHSPYRNFKEIIGLEESYCAQSSFYVMATDRDIRPFRVYEVEDLESDLGLVVDKGWEVGLHGGYYAFNDLAEIKKEKSRLEKVLGKEVYGYRNHYLRFKVPNTWKYLAKAGFKYDTTLGYSNIVGFRNGMCHPFSPFDLTRGGEIDIYEIPLSIMDGTLFKNYQSPREIWGAAKMLIDSTEKYTGVLTLLWHNNVFSSPYRDHWKKLYIKIMEYCSSKGAWMTSGGNICRHWQKNNGSHLYPLMLLEL
jgi:peptidoglycan/xylan/chitin deacetylase (PgdA/CDA1 family)